VLVAVGTWVSVGLGVSVAAGIGVSVGLEVLVAVGAGVADGLGVLVAVGAAVSVRMGTIATVSGVTVASVACCRLMGVHETAKARRHTRARTLYFILSSRGYPRTPV
jgi:hypothetical protein